MEEIKTECLKEYQEIKDIMLKHMPHAPDAIRIAHFILDELNQTFSKGVDAGIELVKKKYIDPESYPEDQELDLENVPKA